MENSSTYKNLDLRKVTVYDIAELFPDKPVIFVSSENDLSDEQERILYLYTFADYYKIEDLKSKLESLFKTELLSLS